MVNMIQVCCGSWVMTAPGKTKKEGCLLGSVSLVLGEWCSLRLSRHSCRWGGLLSETVCQHRQIKSLQFKTEHVCETQPGSILLVERGGFRQGSLPRRGLFEVGLQRGRTNLNKKYAFDIIRTRGVQPSPGA